MKRVPFVLLCVLEGACMRDATPAKFADRPIVWASDDRRPIVEPTEKAFYPRFYLADAMVFTPVIETFDRPARGPAGDVNALDEVPDSTWFTNRIGIRDLTPEEAAQGPDPVGPPQLPLQVVKAKAGGANPGFVALDARGTRYLVKFDTKANPEQQTATDAIVGKILWDIGYHTPAETVVYFRRDQLSLAPALRAKGTVRDADIDIMLLAATRRGDSFRASASAFLAGAPKGGWPARGLRADDPNDRVPHEQRRVLRGFQVIAAWLNHTDMKEDNSIDMYVGDPGKQYLMHYLVDFGEALGGHQSEKDLPQIGYEYGWDYKNQGKALLAFGLWHRPWENQVRSPWPSVGYFGLAAFDPREWHERYPYSPFHVADRTDLYWGAKLVMRFTRAQLEAIVATGQLTDPAAATYLVDTLLARRDVIGRAYLDTVTPLENIVLAPNRLCAVDLARKTRIAGDGDLVVAGQRHAIAADGTVCIPLATAPGYHVVEAQIARRTHTTPALEIHYIGGATPHVVGLVR
ncbi:MAG: hypothetical protein WKG01_13870 [Kofleriaceae bacterium]